MSKQNDNEKFIAKIMQEAFQGYVTLSASQQKKIHAELLKNIGDVSKFTEDARQDLQNNVALILRKDMMPKLQQKSKILGKITGVSSADELSSAMTKVKNLIKTERPYALAREDVQTEHIYGLVPNENKMSRSSSASTIYEEIDHAASESNAREPIYSVPGNTKLTRKEVVKSNISEAPEVPPRPSLQTSGKPSHDEEVYEKKPMPVSQLKRAGGRYGGSPNVSAVSALQIPPSPPQEKPPVAPRPKILEGTEFKKLEDIRGELAKSTDQSQESTDRNKMEVSRSNVEALKAKFGQPIEWKKPIAR